MGGGKHKAHQSYAVSPAAVLDHPSEPEEGVEVVLDGPGEDHLVVTGAGLAAPAVASPAANPGVVDHNGENAVELVAGPGEEAVIAAMGAEEILGQQGPDQQVGTAQSAPPGLEALTPVPTEPPVGDICGTPLLVGGADLDDSLATLISYQDQAGPREVLLATVEPEAEAKLYEALALSEEKLVPVAVEKEVSGRLPVDESEQLYEQLATVAKSVNHHLKAGDDVPDHTKQNFAKVVGRLGEVEGATTSEADRAMLDHYQAAATAIAERLYTVPYPTHYDQGGKVPLVTPYETTGKVTVTEYVPAPAEGVPEGKLSAQVRDATRIGSVVDDAGVAHWDGKARSKASGKEYVVDLGDGYAAVYRPHVAVDATNPAFSQRGSLELIAPQGAGHGPELVGRMGELNLVNRPMSVSEGEWSYLRRNVEAQGLGAKPAVAKAMAAADGLEDATAELLVAERAHEAIGMSQPQLVGFAKQLRLEAEARALPAKVTLVRDAVAKTTGFAGGAELAASPGYDPTPRPSGGWLVWDRFDVAADPAKAGVAFGARGFGHRVTGNNLVEIIRNGGVLASTERRRLMGVSAGKGMSESSDMGSGGAKSVFLRVQSKPSAGPALFWDDPSVLLRRSDWYAYKSDHFGSLNPESGHSTGGLTRDPAKVAAFNGGSNEVMFKHGIDLLGAEAPSLIRCGSAAERKGVLEVLAARGITHLGSKPVSEVVK